MNLPVASETGVDPCVAWSGARAAISVCRGCCYGFDQDPGVWYDLYAFSRPGVMARMGYLSSRALQKGFARDSVAAMQREVAVRRSHLVSDATPYTPVASNAPQARPGDRLLFALPRRIASFY